MLRSFLGLNIDGLIAVHRIENERSVHAFGIGGGKAGIPAATPLHGSPYSIAVAEVDVVPHADFVAVIDDGSAGERHQHPVHQLNAPAVVVEQWSKPAPDAEINPHGLLA